MHFFTVCPYCRETDGEHHGGKEPEENGCRWTIR